MKTQISDLRSGTKKQVLNPRINYALEPSATSHIGHAGTNGNGVAHVWEKVISENPAAIKISIFGKEVILTAQWSFSGKSINYVGDIPKDFLPKFGIEPSHNEPYITIHNANTVTVHNGKKSYAAICPSLITILD